MRLPRRVLDRLHDGYLARRLLPATVLDRVDRGWARACLADYAADPRPGGAGYALHREAFLRRALGDARLIEAFRSGAPLPKGYGVGVDERCVGFPWMVAHLPAEPAALLDAGYRYTAGGWDLVSAEDCARSEYVRAWNGPPERLRRPFPIEPDRAVNARAVACVRLVKPPSRPERPT